MAGSDDMPTEEEALAEFERVTRRVGALFELAKQASLPENERDGEKVWDAWLDLGAARDK